MSNSPWEVRCWWNLVANCQPLDFWQSGAGLIHRINTQNPVWLEQWNYWLDLCHVSLNVSQFTDHLSPSISVLCCHLHLRPAVPEAHRLHLFLKSLFHAHLECSLSQPTYSVHYSAWLAMLLYHVFLMHRSQFHLILLRCYSNCSLPIVFHSSLIGYSVYS